MNELVHNTVLTLFGFEIAVMLVIYMCISFLDKDLKFLPAREWAARLNPMVWLLIMTVSMVTMPLVSFWPVVEGKSIYFELFCPPLTAIAIVGIYSFMYSGPAYNSVRQ